MILFFMVVISINVFLSRSKNNNWYCCVTWFEKLYLLQTRIRIISSLPYEMMPTISILRVLGRNSVSIIQHVVLSSHWTLMDINNFCSYHPTLRWIMIAFNSEAFKRLCLPEMYQIYSNATHFLRSCMKCYPDDFQNAKYYLLNNYVFETCQLDWGIQNI